MIFHQNNILTVNKFAFVGWAYTRRPLYLGSFSCLCRYLTRWRSGGRSPWPWSTHSCRSCERLRSQLRDTQWRLRALFLSRALRSEPNLFSCLPPPPPPNGARIKRLHSLCACCHRSSWLSGVLLNQCKVIELSSAATTQFLLTH